MFLFLNTLFYMIDKQFIKERWGFEYFFLILWWERERERFIIRIKDVVVELWNIKHHAFLCNWPASHILCMRFDKFSLLYLPMDLISAKLKQIFVQCQNLGLPCLERLSDILSSPSIDPMVGTCTSENCT